MKLPTIQSNRLVLRPLTQKDAPAIATSVGNWDVAQNLSRVPYPYQDGGAESFIARNNKGLAGINFAITQEDRLIGLVGVKSSTERANGDFVPSIGYWLDQAFWGKGYMKEAVSRFLDWYMPLEPTERVRSAVFEDNPRSFSILSHLGFAEISRSEGFSAARGKAVPQIDLELTKDRYYEAA